MSAIKRRDVNWTGHILCGSCLVEHFTEGNIEGRIQVMGRRGRGRKQVRDE